MKLLEEKSFLKFKKDYGNYNVNVYKHSRMVHKKDGCYCSEPYQFIPFNSLEEIYEFENKYDIQFTFCRNSKCGFK